MEEYEANGLPENQDEPAPETVTVYEVCELDEDSSYGEHGALHQETQKAADKKGYYPQRYREAWEKLPEFKGWLRRSHINRKNPFCCACNCELIGGKSELQRHAKSSKHKRMLQTLSSEGLVAHPTVRVKGTESNYTPVQCMDTDCSDIPAHVHCPLCLKKERAFQEPVALDIHFQEIHVEKSLDFGGLRILCCCLDCDICVPARGGDQSKKITGSHWHCFRCRRGFNRRSEANRHYRSHFKNPNATMEIHISHEVNIPQSGSEESSSVMDGLSSIVESILANSAASSQQNLGVALESEEMATLSSSTLSQNENQESGDVIMVYQPSEGETQNAQPSTPSSVTSGTEVSSGVVAVQMKERSQLEKVTVAILGEIKKLNAKYNKLEQSMASEINQLKSLVQQQAKEIQELKQQQEPVSSAEGHIYQLVNKLQSEHNDMLRKHMHRFQQAFYQGGMNAEMSDAANQVMALVMESGMSQPSLAAISPNDAMVTSTPVQSPMKAALVKPVKTSSGPTVISLRADLPSSKDASD